MEKVKRMPSCVLLCISDIYEVRSVGVTLTVHKKLKADDSTTGENNEDDKVFWDRSLCCAT